jgi:hypothetical protein
MAPGRLEPQSYSDATPSDSSSQKSSSSENSQYGFHQDSKTYDGAEPIAIVGMGMYQVLPCIIISNRFTSQLAASPVTPTHPQISGKCS